MRRILISGTLFLMLLSVVAFLLIIKGGPVPPAEPASPPLTPPEIPGYKPGVVVTTQELADRFGLPIIHPHGRGQATEFRISCWTERNAERCQFWVYYPDGWYLWVVPLAPYEKMGADWQEFELANDTRGIMQLVTVQGQLGVGWGLDSGGGNNPHILAGRINWYDPSRDWLIYLLGLYNLQPLVDIANGPWCTLATPDGVDPPVPFC